MSGRKEIGHDHLTVQNLLKIGCTSCVVACEHIEVEHKTLVHAVVIRHTGMQYTRMHKYHFPCTHLLPALIQRHIQRSVQHTDDLVFGMPVIVHLKSGVIPVQMIKSKRKIGGSVLSLFIQVHILHVFFLRFV